MELVWDSFGLSSCSGTPFKLNPNQTAAMIKVAVTRPSVHKNDIRPLPEGIRYQFQSPICTEVRILPPAVKFQDGGIADPKFSGRWDLHGKKFWQQNMVPLKYWGFVALEEDVPFPMLQQFENTFKTTYVGYGKLLSDPKLLNTPGQM
ncbi:hypothetical protein BGZ63DRAFT_408162 [Mariannaea sp. PMI_226]|nr:hypothetical protein BGZ63DRAFT_408162 [Mariannaea sp. PMI_226]